MTKRLILAWLGVIPLALLAAIVTRWLPWEVRGYPVVASLMLVAYIVWALFWAGLAGWSRAPVARTPPVTRAVPVAAGEIWRTPVGDEYVQLNRYQRLRALLQEALDEYVEHQNFRCAHKDRWPECQCGLDDFERRVREELADG